MYNVNISESHSVITPFLRLKADDPDYEPLTRYKLQTSSGDTNGFNLNPETGDLTLTKMLDYEKKKFYSMEVIAYDSEIPKFVVHYNYVCYYLIRCTSLK